jgi:diadenosine tetraphosphate (Ap4A) HIT family hydrolase
LLDLLARTKAALDEAHSPAGYNIGINDGAAAGQTIAHLHIHLIPRYAGDQPDPRGGVRWIFPERANYWDGGR